MKKYHFTFGQNHTHRINGFTYDCDVVCEIEAESYEKARGRMFGFFSDQWSHQYDPGEVLCLNHHLVFRFLMRQLT